MKVHNYSKKHLIFGLLFLLSNKLQTIGDSFFDDITTKQWFILLVMKIMSGYEPNLSELAEAAGSSRQNVKQIVLKLEQKGYVELTKDSKDARHFRIKTTPKCLEFEKAHEQRSQEFLEQLFDNLEDSALEITFQTLTKLQKNLEKEYKDGSK